MPAGFYQLIYSTLLESIHLIYMREGEEEKNMYRKTVCVRLLNCLLPLHALLPLNQRWTSGWEFGNELDASTGGGCQPQ